MLICRWSFQAFFSLHSFSLWEGALKVKAEKEAIGSRGMVCGFQSLLSVVIVFFISIEAKRKWLDPRIPEEDMFCKGSVNPSV